MLTRIIKQEKLLLVIIYIFFFLVHLLMGLLSGTRSPLVYADEYGYIGVARHILYGQHEFTDYYPGYGLFLIPIFMINNNISLAYPLIQVLNSIVASFIPVLSYKLVSIYKKDANIFQKLMVSVTVSLYPAYLLYTNLALTEILFSTVFVILTILVYYLSLEPKRVLIWVSVIITYSYLVLIHPRAFAVFPVLLLTFLLILYLNLMNRFDKKFKQIISISLLIIIILFVGIAFYLVINSGSYSLNQKIGIYLSFNGIFSILLTFCSQLYYLILSTYGFVLFGIYYAVRLIKANWKNKEQNNIVVLFTLLSFLGIMGISATFMSTPSRADHIIYGRYNEGALIPVFILGLLYFVENKMNKKIAINLLLFSFGIAILVWRVFGEELETWVMNTVNIFGILAYRSILMEFDYWQVTLMFFILGLFVLVCGIKKKGLTLAFMSFFFTISSSYATYDYFIFGSNVRSEQKELVPLLQRYANSSESDYVTFDREVLKSTFWHYYNYSIYVPELKFETIYLSNHFNEINSEVLVSSQYEINNKIKGARIAALENHYPIIMWVLPGKFQDDLIKKGYVLPEKFPSILPDEAFRSSIEPKFKFGEVFSLDDDIQLPVSITHTGSGSIWPNLYGVKRVDYSVRVGVKLFDRKELSYAFFEKRIELPRSIYPGETFEIQVPLTRSDFFSQRKILPDGEYILRIELVQENAVWFTQMGDKALNILIKLQDENIQIVDTIDEINIDPSNFDFNSIKPHLLLSFNKRSKDENYFVNNLFNFLGNWTENGKGIIDNINYPVKPNDYYIELKTYGWRPTYDNLNLKLFVNNQELLFSHRNGNSFYFILDKNIKKINKIEIHSSTFSPIKLTNIPKFLGVDEDNVSKIRKFISQGLQKKGINIDSNVYGIDVKSIDIKPKYQKVGNIIKPFIMNENITNFMEDNIWTDGQGVIKDISYTVKPNEHYLILKTMGWNPYKNDLVKLGLNLYTNGQKLEFDHQDGDFYYFKLNKEIKEINHIKISSSTFVPKDLGINDDTRALGIDVEYIEIR